MATTLETLIELNRLGLLPGELPGLPPPAPSMPLGVATPPLAGPPPTMPDAVPLPPADTSFVNNYAGPAPVAPTFREPSTLAKIGAALSGINAGFQGRGGEFAAQLREERDRPQREYQAQLERFQGRRTQGIELDERRRERVQDAAMRKAERQADREFEMWARRANIEDAEARETARRAFDLQKQRERERAEDERQEKQLRGAQEKQRREIENKLASDDGAPANIAKEISEYQVGLRPELSAAAQKWRGLRAQKLAAQLARVGGSGGGGGQLMAELSNGQIIPASLIRKETGTVTLNGQPVNVVRYIGGNIPSRPQAAELMPGEPGGPQGPPTPRTETLAGGIRMTTPAPTMKRDQAKAKLIKGGYTSKEADAELDRLGIQ